MDRIELEEIEYIYKKSWFLEFSARQCDSSHQFDLSVTINHDSKTQQVHQQMFDTNGRG